jgi:hypothetical protein
MPFSVIMLLSASIPLSVIMLLSVTECHYAIECHWVSLALSVIGIECHCASECHYATECQYAI